MQSFDSYENYLFDSYHRKYYIGFSQTEQYDTEKGYDRFTAKPIDYALFGKLYIRSALERTLIQRKYMKLTEFAANMSAILSEILLILFVSVRYINRFYSKQSILKQVFGFRNTIGNESQIKATKTVNNKLSSQTINSSKALNNSIINVVNDKNSIEKVNNLSSSNVIMNFKKYSLKALPQNETIYKIKNLQPSKPIRSSKIQSDTFHMNLLQMLITLIVPCL